MSAKKPGVSQGNKTGFVSGGSRPPLTDVEREYLHLFTVERLTVREASIRRKCSLQNTRRYLRRLIEAGYIDKNLNVTKQWQDVSAKQGGGATSAPKTAAEVWRLHRVHVTVQVLDGHLQGRYKERVGSQIEVKGNTVLVHARSLEVYLGTSFTSAHPYQAAHNAAQYLLRVLRVVENDLHILCVKDRSQNIRWVGGEYAKGNDVISTQPGAAKLRVFDREDGKTRVLVDFSPGSIPELEFLHKQKALPDSVKYQDFIQDVIDERYGTALSAISSAIAAQAQMQERIHEHVERIGERVLAQSKMQDGLAQGMQLQVEHMNRLLQALTPQAVQPQEPDLSELRRWC